MKKICFGLMALVFTFAEHNLFAVKFQMKLGDVKIERAKKPMPLNSEADLKDKDIVTTGEKSLLVIEFDNGDVIKIKEKTKAIISLASPQTSAITVLKGTIEAKYKKIMRENPSKVYSPTTVAAVRGTEFEVTVAESGETRVKMTEGKLNVSNPSGDIDISGKESSEIVPGSKPDSASADASSEEWMNSKSQEFNENPSKYTEGYKAQLKQMNERSAQNKIELKKTEGQLKTIKTEEEFASYESSLDKAKNATEDDMNINAASGLLVEEVSENIKSLNIKAYKDFTLLKKEINKVKEQQERNLEEIRKVLEAYKKAKEEILSTHKKSVEEILKGTK
ncbi:MAG TPA: FecR family protein [Spirochaetota bacterium]|nr:FecR family protein [Spirochaetota bacterium]HOH36451.1 FecR family protein [Spirochaetota bacterium]HPJ13859.1 FecR family protein [Spirochaetota bacterium]